MRKPLALYGAGGLGREVLSLVKALPEWEVKGFYDDGLQVGAHVKDGLHVLGGLEELKRMQDSIFIVLSVGSPQVKQKLACALSENKNIHFPSLVHPSVILQDPAFIKYGQGCILGAGTVMTTEISIGDHVLINLNCTIGHNVGIEMYSSVMPGVNIAGEVTIGEGVLVGAGASIINRLSVGANSRIGSGAVVIESVPANSTAVGVPARVIKRSHE